MRPAIRLNRDLERLRAETDPRILGSVDWFCFRRQSNPWPPYTRRNRQYAEGYARAKKTWPNPGVNPLPWNALPFDPRQENPL